MKKLIIFIILCLNVHVCFAEETDVCKPLDEEQVQIVLGQFLAEWNSIYDAEREMWYSEETKVSEHWPFDEGETFLHMVVARFHDPATIRFLIRQLIGKGLDVNAMAYVGLSSMLNPLSCALIYKNDIAAKELLKAGANPNTWIEEGYNFIGTPCHIIAREYGDDPSAARDIIADIVKAGGNINAHDELSSKEIMDLTECEPEFAEHKTIFMPRKQWNDDDPCGNMRSFSHAAMREVLATLTPLMWAVLCDNVDIVDILLDFNADVNIRSVENKSAVDYANELPENSKIKNSPVFKKLKSIATH